jgi:hypothetical protein
MHITWCLLRPAIFAAAVGYVMQLVFGILTRLFLRFMRYMGAGCCLL